MKLSLLKFSCELATLTSLFILLLQPATATQPQVFLTHPATAFPGVDPQQDQPDNAADDKEDDNVPEEQGEITDTASFNTKPDISDKFVRFHMWDGSIVAGEVDVDNISIKTEFGTLRVPIERIKKLYPGLDSFPELDAKITRLVEDLGNKDFEIREKSHRTLSAMGMQIRTELNNLEDGGSAERKKRLASIKAEIATALDELEEEELSAERSLIRGDAVETPEFSMVGKILQETFLVNSKFGQLNVMLSDIKMAERSFNETPKEIRKSVDVDAEAFFQRKPTSTRIRVSPGNRITIRAEGLVQWTNWSTTSSPDGMTNQGQYEGINSGKLCARIGSSGKVIEVGSKAEIVAKRSGILYLAIAMQDNYLADNTGYRWTGKYRTKIRVRPTVRE